MIMVQKDFWWLPYVLVAKNLKFLIEMNDRPKTRRPDMQQIDSTWRCHPLTAIYWMDVCTQKNAFRVHRDQEDLKEVVIGFEGSRHYPFQAAHSCLWHRKQGGSLARSGQPCTRLWETLHHHRKPSIREVVLRLFSSTHRCLSASAGTEHDSVWPASGGNPAWVPKRGETSKTLYAHCFENPLRPLWLQCGILSETAMLKFSPAHGKFLTFKNSGIVHGNLKIHDRIKRFPLFLSPYISGQSICKFYCHSFCTKAGFLIHIFSESASALLFAMLQRLLYNNYTRIIQELKFLNFQIIPRVQDTGF